MQIDTYVKLYQFFNFERCINIFERNLMHFRNPYSAQAQNAQKKKGIGAIHLITTT